MSIMVKRQSKLLKLNASSAISEEGSLDKVELPDMLANIRLCLRICMNTARQPFLLSCIAILCMESRNPNYREYVAKKVSTNRFLHHIGFQITKLEPGYMEGEVPFETFLQQQDGFVHGGVTSTIADMVMGFAAYSMVEEGRR
jgi:hypothetical protein